MTESPDKPPRKAPWEIGVLRFMAGTMIAVGGLSGFGTCMASEGLSTGQSRWDPFVYVAAVIVASAGLLLRALCGAWSALERIANRDGC